MLELAKTMKNESEGQLSSRTQKLEWKQSRIKQTVLCESEFRFDDHVGTIPTLTNSSLFQVETVPFMMLRVSPEAFTCKIFSEK